MEKEHRDGKPEPEASERASERLAMRRDVRAYREHLHVVASDPARAVRAGPGHAEAEQEKLSKGVDEDDLEAVLAVSPVRLVLDQDQEEAADLSEEPREDAGHVGMEAEVHESDVLAALHREWLPPPPPLSGPQNNEPSQTANAMTSLDEQRIEYELTQQPRTESPFRPAKRVPSQIENINLPHRDTTKQTMLSQHDRAAEQTPRLTSKPAGKKQERESPAQALEPKPKITAVPLHEYAAARQDQERPTTSRADGSFPKGKNAKPVFSPIPEIRAKPRPLPEKPKVPLKSRWRKAAKAHRERLQRRDKDFVSWTAQSMKMTRHGTESFTALPNAPVPRGPRRVKSLQDISREYEDKNVYQRPHRDNAEEEKALEKERQELVARAKSKLARKQAKAEALSAATQTPVPTPSPLRRWVVLEHVPVNELDCLRVLRGDRSGLDSNDLMGADEPTREELEDPMLKRFHEERRRLGASFEAIRGIIAHRENALFRELVEDRDELECAKAELRKQILAALANNQDPDSSENRNRRKFKRNPLQEVSPFVCGTTPATASTNQQVRTSMAAAARRKQKAAVKQEHQDAENAWEGSPFKIKLLQEVIDKLQKRIAFRVLCWTARRRVMLRKLCAEREELAKRLELRRAFIGLATLHRARAWLRERARKRRAHRARSSLRNCWKAWKAFSVEAALALGKAVTAEAYKRRKTLWRAFAVWRAQPLAIERYETVANLCARRFFFEVSTRRALFGWRQVTVRDKLVRLRLVCRASESRLGAEARVPERWTRAGMRGALSLACVASRARLQDSLQQSTIGLAQGAVSSICVAVRWQAHVRQSIDRRQAARDAYILCARAARKAYSSARARRVSLASQLPAQLMNLGLGRLAARPLGQHIAALRSFVAGNSLRYGLPTENDRRRPRSPKAKTPEHSRFDPGLAWLSARTPYPDPKWRRDLPLALASVRLLRKSLHDWHETAHAIACVRRGDFANDLLLVKRVWRGLRTNVMLGRLRTHLIAWRQTLDRGTCEGKRARTKRAFFRWRAIASRRRLLRRVFSLTDPPADQLTEQFWLLSKVLAGWQNFVQTQRSARHGIAADLHYEQNLLAKAFSGWRALHGDSLGRRFLCAGSVVDAATARAILWHM